MSEQSAADICKALLAENYARMDGVHDSGDADEMVSPLDQLVGVAFIMRTVGLPVIRQQRNLTGHNADGDPIQYETMALLVERELIGLELEDDWDGIEANTRLYMGTSLSRRLTQRTQPVNLEPADDEKSMQDIAQHFPRWHHWIDEKIAELSHIELDSKTRAATAPRPSARL